MDRDGLIGNSTRRGRIQRLGWALLLISFALVLLACNARGTALLRYNLFVAAHAFLYTGYLMIAVADATARRPFCAKTLTLAFFWFIILVILGPIVMSAAAATLTR